MLNAWRGLGNEVAISILSSSKIEEIKTMFKWFSVLILAVLLSACGNKGALYLPGNGPDSQQESSSTN